MNLTIWPTFGIRMNTLGFSVTTTGGNCRAYTKQLMTDGAATYVLVTDKSGCGVDGIGPDNWIVGLYDAATDGEILMHYADGGSIDAALRAVEVLP